MKKKESLKLRPDAINKMTFFDKLHFYKDSPSSLILMILLILCSAITAFFLIFIVIYIVVKGVPYLRPSMFAWKYTSENLSMLPSIINTIEMTIISLIVATPLGVFCAIYLTEYAKRGNIFVKIIRITTQTLSGIPSIVYGLFGMLCFVTFLKFGYSILAGALTLSIMILPLIIRETEEAIIAVPDSYREASYGLGAGKLRTVFKAVLPSAIPGILAGVILSVGRIVGETAALMYTSGTVAKLAGPMDTGETLALHMYVLSNEGLHVPQAYATSFVLLIVVGLMDILSDKLAKKFAK